MYAYEKYVQSNTYANQELDHKQGKPFHCLNILLEYVRKYNSCIENLFITLLKFRMNIKYKGKSDSIKKLLLFKK